MENKKSQSKVLAVFISLLAIVLISSIFVFAGGGKGDKYDYLNTTEEKLKDESYQNHLRESDSFRILKDNKYKSYNSSERIITIEDNKYETLIKLKLLSNYKQHVGVGKDIKVAEFLLIDYSSGDLFDVLDFYNIKQDYKKEVKQFKLKYATDYLEEICYNLSLGFNNETNQSLGNEIICYNESKTDWIEFITLKDLTTDSLRIGIFTDTILGEYIEWVPTIEGFECLEWASYLVDGLVSYYKLDESSGTIIDELGTNNATYNGALYSQTGKIGTSIGFDGVNDKVSKTDMGTSLGDRDTFSVSMWINPDVVVGFDYIFALGDAVNPSRGININSDSKISYRPSGDAQVAFNTTVSVGNWYHIVITYDGTNIKGYQDGILRLEMTDTNTIAVNPNLLLGWFSDSYQYDGDTDEVGIWNYALNQTAVTDLYNSGSGLAYPFEEDTCSCPGVATNWEISLADYCNITTVCNITTGNITFINNGSVMFNSTLTANKITFKDSVNVIEKYNLGSIFKGWFG